MNDMNCMPMPCVMCGEQPSLYVSHSLFSYKCENGHCQVHGATVLEAASYWNGIMEKINLVKPEETTPDWDEAVFPEDEEVVRQVFPDDCRAEPFNATQFLHVEGDDLGDVEWKTVSSCDCNCAEEYEEGYSLMDRVKDAIFEEEESEDNWKHRSEGMICGTCMWYVMKQTGVPGVAEIGRCRRHAPTMNGYPAVYVTDWCGDHKIDEEKL